MKSPRRYWWSKILFIVLAQISLVVDWILALAGYDWLIKYLPDTIALPILLFIASSVFGVILYLLDRWQLEHLTGHKDD